MDRCWKMIDEQTETAVKSDGFATIERSLLEAVVVRDTLKIKEVDLFQAVDLWAAKECEEQGLAANGEMKRRILGEQIIKAIRFPVMKDKEFAAVVIDANILTPEETMNFFKFFTSTLTSPVGFPETKRSGIIHRCGRFASVSESGWNYGGAKDYLVFSVDKDIIFHGLCLFGSENNDYTVTLEVKDASDDSTVVSKTGIFFSGLLQYKSSNYYGFEVLFDSAVKLKRNMRYQIEALISGAMSWKGSSGMNPVQSSNVLFTFSSCGISGNGTIQLHGQFPEFMFSEL